MNYLKPGYFYALLLILSSCINSKAKIIHIDYLTEIDTRSANGYSQINRDDYFIIYNSTDSIELKNNINKTIKPYSDSFSDKFGNYRIFLYKESTFADTSYIKSFGENYYYKALLDEKAYMVFHWWAKRLISK